MKKFIISKKKYRSKDKENFINLSIWLKDKDDLFAINDVVAMVSYLDLNPLSFDYVYADINIEIFESNEKFDVFFNYVDCDKVIILSIRCKEGTNRIDKLVSKLIECEVGKDLLYYNASD